MPFRKKNRRALAPRQTLDASESIHFQGQLETIRTAVYEKKFPELKARSLIPIDNEEDPALEVMRYRMYSPYGSAKIIASYADDLPRSDLKGETFRAEIRSIGSSYGYNLQEIRASRRNGTNLEQRRANIARRMIETEIDRIARAGDSDNGLLGLLNQPNALIMTVPNGASASPLWTSKTEDEILADLFNLASNSYRNTNQLERANTILLPFSSLELITRTRIGDTNETILSFFRRVNAESETPITRITSWTELETAGSGGTRRAVAYRNDPDALSMRIPQEFEQLPEEKRNLEWVTDCHARAGGVVAFFPFSITYADGI